MKKSKYLSIRIKLLITFTFLSLILLKAQTFGKVVIGGGGHVTAIIAGSNKNSFYAKTDVGGIAKWNEESKSWNPLSDWLSSGQTGYLGVESFAIDPQHSNIIYALSGTSYWEADGIYGGTAILRSDNYGSSFSINKVTSLFRADGNGENRNKGEALAVDPNNSNILFCGTRKNGLFKSTNSGKNWNETSLPVADESISFVVIDKNSGTPGGASKRIYVGVFRNTNNLYVSHDGGNTWKSVPTGNLPMLSPQRCDYANDGCLYITYSVGKNGIVAKYNTYSGEWTRITPDRGKPYSGISVSKSDPKKIVVSTCNSFDNKQEWGDGDHIYYSSDGGVSWDEKTNKADGNDLQTNGVPWITGHSIHWIADIKIDPNNSRRVFATSGNGIFCCEDITKTPATWKFMAEGLEEVVPIDMISVPGGPLISSVMDQGGYIHTNIKTPPAAAISASSGFACAGRKPGFVARVSSLDLFYSTDYGKNWSTAGRIPNDFTKGTVAVSADGKIFIRKALVSGKHLCYRTDDRGDNWSLVSGLSFDCSPVGDPVNELKFYAYNPTDGYMYVSTNGGRSFSKKDFVETGGNTRFSTVAGAEGRIWIALNGKGLYYSNDSGNSFTKMNVSMSKSVSLGKGADGATYSAVYIWGRPTSTSTTGLYRSNDVGKTWTRINDDKHEYGGLGNAGMIEADMNVYGRVYMSSAGLGIPYVESASLRSASVDDETNIQDPDLSPEKCNASAYPNPFIDGITIKAGSSTLKSIRILNMQGAVIKTYSVFIPQGGSIQVGNDLAPGIYYIQLSDMNNTKTVKAIKK